METESHASTPKGEFSGWRGIVWPIYNFELKKFLPMSFMMIFILFNYTVLRDTKDTLIIHAPAGGAECLSFLKFYGVTPSAILFTIIFFKLSNFLDFNKVFYVFLSGFILFFGIFGFIIYPNRELFHMSFATIEHWQDVFPNLHWFIPLLGNWSFSIFYILSELWGSIVLSMLFWQFANQITQLHEAKRFYSLFGMIGNLGLLCSGTLLVFSSKYAKAHSENIHSFDLNIKILMSIVVFAGICILFLFRWMNKNDGAEQNISQAGAIKKPKKEKLTVSQSLKYIMHNPYLLLIALLILCYGISINLVEGIWKGQIKIAFPNMNDYNAFMGKFSFTTGAVTICMMIVGANILRRFKWRTAALITPVMMLVSSSIFFFVVFHNISRGSFTPILGTTTVMIAVIVGLLQNSFTKGIKYSLFDSTKNMVYIPLDSQAKSKGQAAVEVIGGRAGKSGGAVIQSTLLAVISGSVSLASLAYILGPLVIFICILWVGSVFILDKKFTALLEQKKALESAQTQKPAVQEPATSPV